MERGLAVGPGVGLGLGLGLMLGGGVAVPAPLGAAAGVAVLEQAATTSSRERNEPIRARRAVSTLSSPISYVAVAS
jgi:hypothetical protein